MSLGHAARPRIAILDDYQGLALACADWSSVTVLADITVFEDHLSEEDALAERLAPFEVVCIMRERTPFPRTLLERLPNLKLIASTGPVNAALDITAAERLGIAVSHTAYSSTPTIELTWALILASQRAIVEEATSLRNGGWQVHLGRELAGRTLGIVGLGHIGSAVAKIAVAFGMNVIAWSENLTPEKAWEAGAARVGKEELFANADIVTIHTLLSRRTRGLVAADLLSRMKPDAWLVNTSRGPIVQEAAVLTVLRTGSIGGYAVDVFSEEPLPKGHPFRTLPNVLATPHIGYVAADLYRIFYGDCARTIATFLDRR